MFPNVEKTCNFLLGKGTGAAAAYMLYLEHVEEGKVCLFHGRTLRHVTVDVTLVFEWTASFRTSKKFIQASGNTSQQCL